MPEAGASAEFDVRFQILIRLLRLQLLLRLEEKKSQLRRALRRREHQRQIFHGFVAVQARGLARHVRPQTFSARFLKLRLTRIPKLLLRGNPSSRPLLLGPTL